MANEMETGEYCYIYIYGLLGFIRVILGLYRDNGK